MDNINDILAKYWDGETSLSEEQTLRTYFAKDDINEEHLAFKPLFDFYGNELSIEEPKVINTNIDLLLESYWDGKTSLVEETILKDYFAKDEVLEKHQEFKPLFDFFKVQESVSTTIDKEQLLKASNSVPTAKVRKMKFGRRIMATAASLLLLAMVFFAVKDNIPNPETEKPSFGETYDNPEEALAATMEALSFLSKNLDHNTSQIKRNFKNVAAANILK